MGSKRRRVEEKEVVTETTQDPREDEKVDAVCGWMALDRPIKTWRRLGKTNTSVDVNDVSIMMQRCVLKRRSSNDEEKFKEDEEQQMIRLLFNQIRWADPLVWTSITTRDELPHPLVLQLYLKTHWCGCNVTQKLIENLRLLLTLVNKQQFK